MLGSEVLYVANVLDCREIFVGKTTADTQSDPESTPVLGSDGRERCDKLT
jgi:hypothetical protein